MKQNDLIGKKFTALLLRHKTNKYRIAKATGIPWTTLRRWERGIQKPRADMIERVEAAFQAKAAELKEKVFTFSGRP